MPQASHRVERTHAALDWIPVFFRRYIAPAALVGAAALVLTSCSDDTPATAASVNGRDIATSDVEAQAEIIANDPGVQQQIEGASDEQAQQQINAFALNQLIFEALLLDGAEELGVEISDEDIEATVTEISAQFGGEDEMYAQLEEQGLDRAEVDRQVELATVRDAIIDEMSPEVSEAEVEGAYDAGAPARHILLETEDEAVDAYERIDGGEDFAEVAQEVSMDGSGQNGGDLGFVQPGMTVPPFEDALFGAAEGELVGPVQSDFGFHVIERLEKPALADVEEELRATLEQQAVQEGQMAFQQFLSERMQSADIQVDPAFGEWDPETGQVVPEDPIQPEQPEQPLPEQPEQPEEGSDPDSGDESDDQ